MNTPLHTSRQRTCGWHSQRITRSPPPRLVGSSRCVLQLLVLMHFALSTQFIMIFLLIQPLL